MRLAQSIDFETTVRPTIHNFRALEGSRFGRLTVERFAGIRKKRSYWAVRCECGNAGLATAITLNGGHTRSCGCLLSETNAARNIANATHGENGHNSPEYRSWTAMKSRCNNPNATKYELWGGRGIEVCARWDASFEAFLEDMGRRPSPRHSLDRINSNGNYEPGNCRWATPEEQNRNRRQMKPRRRKDGGR